MSHANYHWDQTFLALFNHCLTEYLDGNQDFTSHYSDSDLEFLGSIGYQPRELFDFVEDFADNGDPSIETAVLVAAVRRDYFLTIQHGTTSKVEMQAHELPARDAQLGGHAWLPRIITKARNKLRGENSPDIMYGCGGDRRFLKQYDIHPADFLRVVWAAAENDQKILDFINSRI